MWSMGKYKTTGTGKPQIKTGMVSANGVWGVTHYSTGCKATHLPTGFALPRISDVFTDCIIVCDFMDGLGDWKRVATALNKSRNSAAAPAKNPTKFNEMKDAYIKAMAHLKKVQAKEGR